MAGCQWVGSEQDPQRGPLVFCGCTPLWPGRSYCEEHVWQVYQKGTALGMNRKNRAIEKELLELKRLEETQNDEV
jgi:hypothetical protein